MLRYIKGARYPLHYNIQRCCQDFTGEAKLSSSNPLANIHLITEVLVLDTNGIICLSHFLHLGVVGVVKHTLESFYVQDRCILSLYLFQRVGRGVYYS